MQPRQKPRVFPEWPLLILAVAVVGAICFPLWPWRSSAAPGEAIFTPERVGRMLLGPEQIACYACFVWACFIIGFRYQSLRRERQAFDLDLIPSGEGLRILPEDARAIQRRVTQMSQRGGPFLLTRLILMGLSRFGISRSPQDAGETIRVQAEVELGRMATSLATVHYLAWAIPAIGFVGTVRGIGMALTAAPDLSDESLPQFLNLTTQSLAFAFDTTLVALLLSLVLMFFLHSIQRGLEDLVLDSQEYCIQNLISKLYDLPSASTEVAATGTDFGGERSWS